MHKVCRSVYQPNAWVTWFDSRFGPRHRNRKSFTTRFKTMQIPYTRTMENSNNGTVYNKGEVLRPTTIQYLDVQVNEDKQYYNCNDQRRHAGQ
jgi:hypothetical protein